MAGSRGKRGQKGKKEDGRATKRRKTSKAESLPNSEEQTGPPPVTSPVQAAESTRSGSPVILFAHGAGANSSSEWMQRYKHLLEKATRAAEVITFDYPYLAGGKRGAPPKAEKLIDFHMGEVEKAQSKHPGHPIVLCGKSMGSRVGCMVAGQGAAAIDAVVCFGYPLQGVNGSMRDQTLLEMKWPVLFVQGSKDNMCQIDKLEGVRKKMEVKNVLHVVDGGDHSLKVPARLLKSTGKTQRQVDEEAVQSVATFLKDVLGGM